MSKNKFTILSVILMLVLVLSSCISIHKPAKKLPKLADCNFMSLAEPKEPKTGNIAKTVMCSVDNINWKPAALILKTRPQPVTVTKEKP